MRTIYKYSVDWYNKDKDFALKVKLPINHKILSIKNQNELPVIYAEVDTQSPIAEFQILMIPTGCELPDLYRNTFIDTVMFRGGELVFHFYR